VSLRNFLDLQLTSISQLKQEFEEGDTVKLGVLENGVRKTKKMEVVRAKLRGGKWRYQVKPSTSNGGQGGGDAEALHRDEDGNDWFAEDELEWG
jgi:hypothetical protein